MFESKSIRIKRYHCIIIIQIVLDNEIVQIVTLFLLKNFFFFSSFQILLNLYCNDHLNFNDGTCCNSREAVTMTQIATFAALCFW